MTNEIKKKKKVVVALKHRKLLKLLSDNVRNGLTMEEAMIAVGYSKSYAKASTRLKDTDSFQQLVEDNLSGKFLIGKHVLLLNKEEILLRNNNRTKGVEVIKTGQPHSDVKGALDMAYKLGKRYGEITITHKFGELTDEELRDSIAQDISEGLREAEGIGEEEE